MLPAPEAPFRWVEIDGRPALVCVPLEAIAPHFFTTRPWQLGSRHANEGDAWRQVAAAARVSPGRLLRLHQVHGSAAVVHRRTDAIGDDAVPARGPDADILITDDPRVALAVQAADCVPLLIGDQRRRVAAAAHAGWRGLAASVPRVAVEALGREFGTRPDDLVAAIGPAISAARYEVGRDVLQKFEEAEFARAQIDRWFTAGARPDHYQFDGAQAARDQLVSAGVPRDQIFVAGLCTASHPDLLCSYRRDWKDAGRMVAVIRASGQDLPGGR